MIFIYFIPYYKPMDITSIKTHGKYYSQETFEVTIYKP